MADILAERIQRGMVLLFLRPRESRGRVLRVTELETHLEIWVRFLDGHRAGDVDFAEARRTHRVRLA